MLVAAVATAAFLPAAALAAPPSSQTPPTIEGNADVPFVGDTLRASRGAWTNNPTTFTYQWYRCDPTGDRQGCAAISGATSSSYTVQRADAGHRLHVRVTARNADGSATRDSEQTGIVSEQAAPRNFARPNLSGSAVVGSQLTTTPGTWAGATSITYQWQQCDSAGAGCADIAGATGRTYTVRSADVGRTVRVEVTATNRYGSTRIQSDRSAVVTTGAPATTSTTVVTTTVAGNRAPTVRFLSLRVRSNRVYVRVRACDDARLTKMTIVARDQKARRLAYTRRFSVRPSGFCGTYSRSWSLIPRFRGDGRFVVTVRVIDTSRRISRPASRSVNL